MGGCIADVDRLQLSEKRQGPPVADLRPFAGTAAPTLHSSEVPSVACWYRMARSHSLCFIFPHATVVIEPDMSQRQVAAGPQQSIGRIQGRLTYRMTAILLGLALSGCSTQQGVSMTPGQAQPGSSPPRIANPSAVACTAAGGQYRIVRQADGAERGVCRLPSGQEYDAWAWFQSQVGPSADRQGSVQTERVDHE